MTFKKFLASCDMNGLELDPKFLKTKWSPTETDRDAAWELYVEMLTRITTQPLPAQTGDEKSALDSVFSLFPTTREIIKKHGRGCMHFAKIAIPVLNQIVRPFTAKWHKESLAGAFKEPASCVKFRIELTRVQAQLKNYTRLLAGIAEVEDLTSLEKESGGAKDDGKKKTTTKKKG